jgi:hypothetical protein
MSARAAKKQLNNLTSYEPAADSAERQKLIKQQQLKAKRQAKQRERRPVVTMDSDCVQTCVVPVAAASVALAIWPAPCAATFTIGVSRETTDECGE